ncbi:MAG: hypothetical protein D6748_09825 [Calditrichaeota bacterium]|nr:MAG: hypothetical protein D6748_09825 [Calditrichota bacterium]
MKRIDFNAPDETITHECESHREGDWIVFHCPECPDYERRINWRTGEMIVKNSDPFIRHQGHHIPEEFKDALLNVN